MENQFFEDHNTPHYPKIVASCYKEGDAQLWLREAEESGYFTNWEAFVKMLQKRFGPTTTNSDNTSIELSELVRTLPKEGLSNANVSNNQETLCQMVETSRHIENEFEVASNDYEGMPGEYL